MSSESPQIADICDERPFSVDGGRTCERNRINTSSRDNIQAGDGYFRPLGQRLVRAGERAAAREFGSKRRVLRTIRMKSRLPGMLILGSLLVFGPFAVSGNSTDDANTVGALDTEYQAAVKKNDAATMGRILADDFAVVTGSGKVYTKIDLIQMAQTGRVRYEHQEDSDRTIRVWGDTAVVTAKLWGKGIDAGEPFDWHVWFSDTYVRTSAGWRYVHGQVSLPLPEATN